MSARTGTETSLRVTRRIEAEPGTVFRAWTEPERMKRWMAPEGYTVAEVEADPRVGGRFRVRMEGPEGAVHTAAGSYREVDPPRRLVYTWDWEEEDARLGGTLVTVEFRGGDDGTTEVVLTHELFPGPDAVADHEKGWTSCLDRLEALLG